MPVCGSPIDHHRYSKSSFSAAVEMAGDFFFFRGGPLLAVTLWNEQRPPWDTRTELNLSNVPMGCVSNAIVVAKRMPEQRPMNLA